MNKKMWIFLTILVNLIFMVSCNSKKNKSVGFEVDSVLISKVIKYDDSLSNSNYPDGYIESIYTNSNKSIIVIGLRDYGLLMSTDNGHHWQKITNGIDMPDATVHDISEDRVREIYYYASDVGVYKSSDDLHSFVRIANALPFELNKIGGRGSMVRNIVVDEVTGDLYARVVKDNFGIYKLDYADKEWYSIGNGLPTGSATQNLCFSSKDNAVYISNGIGGFLTITENDYAMGVYRGKKIIKVVIHGLRQNYRFILIKNLVRPLK